MAFGVTTDGKSGRRVSRGGKTRDGLAVDPAITDAAALVAAILSGGVTTAGEAAGWLRERVRA
jgi:hypothetical protein